MTRLASALGSAYFWADGLQNFSTLPLLWRVSKYIFLFGVLFFYSCVLFSYYCGVHTYHHFKKPCRKKIPWRGDKACVRSRKCKLLSRWITKFFLLLLTLGHVNICTYHTDLSQRGTRKCAAPKGLSILSLSESAQSEGILPLPGLASFGKYGGRFFSGITTSLILW